MGFNCGPSSNKLSNLFPSEAISPDLICFAYSSVNSYFLISEDGADALVSGLLDLSLPETKVGFTVLLFSLSPGSLSSVVLIATTDISFGARFETLSWFSELFWTSSFFSTVVIEFTISELDSIDDVKLFSVEAKTSWDDPNKITPSNAETTPKESFRIEKRWRLLKISFIIIISPHKYIFYKSVSVEWTPLYNCCTYFPNNNDIPMKNWVNNPYTQ